MLTRTLNMTWERARVTEETRARCARGVRRGRDSSEGSNTKRHLGDPARVRSWSYLEDRVAADRMGLQTLQK